VRRECIESAAPCASHQSLSSGPEEGMGGILATGEPFVQLVLKLDVARSKEAGRWADFRGAINRVTYNSSSAPEPIKDFGLAEFGQSAEL